MSKRDIEVDCCNGTFKKLAIAYFNNQDKKKIYCYEYDEDRNVIDIHYFEDKQKIFKDIIYGSITRIQIMAEKKRRSDVLFFKK